MVSIKNLKKSFGNSVILENIDLEIEKGEALVIIGGSGCGKSTLLRSINRLIEPDCGEILINGQNILAKDADVDAIRRRMGMVYQQFNLFSHLNVLENIILAPMQVLGMEQNAAIKEAETLLEQVGMLRNKYSMPNTLSGVPEDKLALSMEKLTLCGVGMCGECYCAGRLACKEGTFYTYSELLEAEETL